MKKGFTLVELLASIVILAFVVVFMSVFVLKLRDEKNLEDIDIQTQINIATVTRVLNNDAMNYKIASIDIVNNNTTAKITYLGGSEGIVSINKNNNTLKYTFDGKTRLATTFKDGVLSSVKKYTTANNDVNTRFKGYTISTTEGDINIYDYHAGSIVVTYYNGNVIWGSDTYEEGETIKQNISFPGKKGYDFDGFYTESGVKYYNSNGTIVNNITLPKNSISLYVHWKQITDLKFTYSGKFAVLLGVSGTPTKYDNTTVTIPKANTADWKIYFLTSGTLTIKRMPDFKIDIFAVGGGGGGAFSSDAYTGGGGGGGGYTKTLTKQSVDAETYTITIGAGGAGGKYSGSVAAGDGGNTTFGSILTAGGGKKAPSATSSTANNGGAGGSGGGAGGGGGDKTTYCCGGTGGTNGGPGGNGYYYSKNRSYGGAGQGTTTCEFHELSSGTCTATAYGSSVSNAPYAGGGSGANGNTSGSATSVCNTVAGGLFGGGAGGGKKTSGSTDSRTNGGNATANSGGGGGGGSHSKNGGAGGSGIVVIRRHKN